MMLKKLYKSRSGITLIEIMIATSVLLVGILGILKAFPQGIATARDIELASTAQQLAQAKIEELNSLAYDEISAGAIENKARVTTDAGSPLYAFQRTTVVQLIDENFASSQVDIGLKKITTTIFWPSVFPGSQRSKSVVAVISSR